MWTFRETKRAADAANSAAAAAEKAIAAANLSSERQLRAYVSPYEARRREGAPLVDAPVFSFKVRNWGQTPASGVSSHSDCKLLPIDAGEENFVVTPSSRAGGYLAPQDEIDATIPFGRKLLAADRDLLTKMSHKIFVFGHVDYVDAFGKPRSRWYRYYWPKGINPSESELGICENGNGGT